jgi:hypothetical protein
MESFGTVEPNSSQIFGDPEVASLVAQLNRQIGVDTPNIEKPRGMDLPGRG